MPSSATRSATSSHTKRSVSPTTPTVYSACSSVADSDAAESLSLPVIPQAAKAMIEAKIVADNLNLLFIIILLQNLISDRFFSALLFSPSDQR